MSDEEIKNEEKEENIPTNDIEEEAKSNEVGSLDTSKEVFRDDITYEENTEDRESLSTKDVTKKLREDLKVCRKEKEEYLTGWQRAKADYINLQKELDMIRFGVSISTKEKMTEKILPALDSFEVAFTDKEHWEKIDKDWQDGIVSIYQQLLSGLASSGIEKINEAEVPFDPNIHQSISVVPTDDESKDHTVEKVLQIGYKIGDRIIRPAKVTIYEYKK